MYARYRIPFKVNLHLVTKERLEIDLAPSDKARLILHPSGGTPNIGDIVVEILEPNETLARNQAEEILKKISSLLSVEKNAQIGPITFERAIFENPKEWEGKVKTSSLDIPSKVTIVGVLDQNEFDKLRHKWDKINRLGNDEADLVFKFLRAYRLGKKGRDPSDELVDRWTALELLVRDPSKQRSTIKSINEFISRRVSEDQARNIIQIHREMIKELIDANLWSFGEPKTNYSDKLKEEFEKIRPSMKAVLTKALLCIYGVRNGVIHDLDTIPVIPKANKMLEYILKDFWGIFLPT